MMEFKDFKVGSTYFSVSDGQYIGAFYVIQKNDKVMKVLTSYYGGVVRIEIVEEEDLEDRFEWMHYSFHLSKSNNGQQIKESLHEIISAIFEETTIATNFARSRR